MGHAGPGWSRSFSGSCRPTPGQGRGCWSSGIPRCCLGDANDILTSLRALASARGDGAAVHTFEVHQALPRRYREVRGPAFDEVIAPGVPAALRPQWIAAEAAYERYRARPGRAAADAAIEDISPSCSTTAWPPCGGRAGRDATRPRERCLANGISGTAARAADLDAAVTCFTAAVHDLPDDAPDRPWSASALGNVLGMRLEERSDPADLDAAIQWSRVSTAAMPGGDGDSHNLCAGHVAEIGGGSPVVEP